jgi:hypothetical protein
MLLFLRYNRIAQVVLGVILIGLIGVGGFFFLSKKSEKANVVAKPVQNNGSANPNPSANPNQTPGSNGGTYTVPKSKESVGDITWSGDLSTVNIDLPKTRKVVNTDPKSSINWPSSGRDLGIRRTDLPISTYYVALMHKESVAILAKMYTETMVKAGYTKMSEVMFGDVKMTKKVTDYHQTFNTTITFTKGSDFANVSIQSPIDIGGKIMPSLVEIKMDKSANANNVGAQVAPNVSSTPVAGQLK